MIRLIVIVEVTGCFESLDGPPLQCRIMQWVLWMLSLLVWTSILLGSINNASGRVCWFQYWMNLSELTISWFEKWNPLILGVGELTESVSILVSHVSANSGCWETLCVQQHSSSSSYFTLLQHISTAELIMVIFRAAVPWQPKLNKILPCP